MKSFHIDPGTLHRPNPSFHKIPGRQRQWPTRTCHETSGRLDKRDDGRGHLLTVLLRLIPGEIWLISTTGEMVSRSQLSSCLGVALMVWSTNHFWWDLCHLLLMTLMHLGVDHRHKGRRYLGIWGMHIFSRWQHLNSHTLGASQTVIQRKFLKVPETIDCERKKWVLNQK